MIKILFYDFEVFEHDWLVVIMNTDSHKRTVFVNQVDELTNFFNEHVNDIWVGYNNKGYDQYILKGIILGMNPKRISDKIIVEGMNGYNLTNAFRQIKMINFDVMTLIVDRRSLKTCEGMLGNSIEESNVQFSIQRKLTKEEIDETIKYCIHDVEQTMEVFLEKQNDFTSQLHLIKQYNLPLSYLEKTKVQLSAVILDATPRNYHDEFNIDLPPTLRLSKYQNVIDFYENYNDYEEKLETIVGGIPHTYGIGGVHGSIDGFEGHGYFLNMDVGSLYPSLILQYDLYSRAMTDEGKRRYKQIYDERLQLKHEGKKKEQAPLKIVLNGTYGAMKDKFNALYDPRNANRICIYGQLLLTDLIEKLESHCRIIQSNTDGVLIQLESLDDYDLIDDIAHEWEKRTHLNLEFDPIIHHIWQKDVNNYLTIDENGKSKSKGAYLKTLGGIDYDLPIINKALKEYMIHNIPLEATINNCEDLKEFQMIRKITSKFSRILINETPIKERCIRIYATTGNGGTLYKEHQITKRLHKIEGTPPNAIIYNADVNGVSTSVIPLDRKWYIDTAKERLKGFINT